MSTARGYFWIEREPDGIAVLHFANPKDGVPNTISRAFMEGLEEVLPTLEAGKDIRGLVVISDRPDWLVGVDLKEIEAMTSEAEVREIHGRVRRAFDRCAALRYPTVAAVAGNAPGGGLEFALIWKYRVITSDPPAKLSQAEVKLGLIPGAGGTQRLPRRVGLSTALPLILTGSTIFPKKALAIGLADDAAPEHALKAAAISLLKKVLANEPLPLKYPGVIEQLAGTGPGRALLEKAALKDIRSKTKGLMPAPEKALRATLDGYGMDLGDGLKNEGELFCPLVNDPVSKSLRHLFHGTNAVKKRMALEGEPGKPRTIEELGVIGGGFMGTGITQVALDAGCRVFVTETAGPAAIGKCVGAVQKYFADKAKKGVLKKFEAPLYAGRLTTGDQLLGLKHAPLIIEAVLEELPIKRAVLAKVEELTGGRAIFASNTSSLSIAAIAAEAKYPTQVIGMHFFSPVPKMPLVEVIVPPLASPETVATTVAFGRRLGKVVIVVRDKVGFYTTRVIGAFCNEVAHILAEGARVEDVDRAVSALGFPVGPVQLMDEVGLDIGAHVNKILHEAYGDRLAPPASWAQLMSPARKGRKSGRGFYLYEDGKRTGVDESVYQAMGPRREMAAGDIADRALYMFVAEALRCYEEQVLPDAASGDIGAVLGIGFPPHLGGPFYHVDRRGAAKVLEKLAELEKRFGPRFEAPAILKEMAAKDGKFYGSPLWQA